MGTSIAIKLLIAAAAATTLYAFYLRIVGDGEFRRLVRWLKGARPREWGALPRHTRWFNAIGAVALLRRGPLTNDAEFNRRYAASKKNEKSFLIALCVGAACIAMVLTGTVYLGWTF